MNHDWRNEEWLIELNDSAEQEVDGFNLPVGVPNPNIGHISVPLKCPDIYPDIFLRI